MLLGGFGPDNLLAIVDRAGRRRRRCCSVQLVAISALRAWPAIGVLARAPAARGPPAAPLARAARRLVRARARDDRRRCSCRARSTGPRFETIRRVTFVVIGLAPVAFLVGLLDARLARSAVGDLLVELRADPAPADLRDALARALRDPSLTLAYWLPEFEHWADVDGREVELPGPDGRQRDDADRARRRARRRAGPRPVARATSPSCSTRSAPPPGIALENARLQAELRARLEELRGSRGRVDRGRPAGAPAARAQPPRRRAAAAGRPLARAAACSSSGSATTPTHARGSTGARREIAASLEELRDVARGHPPGRRQRPRPGGRARVARRAARPCRSG